MSQFTLHAVLKGNKPDFHNSMKPDQAKEMYHQLVRVSKEERGSETDRKDISIHSNVLPSFRFKN